MEEKKEVFLTCEQYIIAELERLKEENQKLKSDLAVTRSAFDKTQAMLTVIKESFEENVDPIYSNETTIFYHLHKPSSYADDRERKEKIFNLIKSFCRVKEEEPKGEE